MNPNDTERLVHLVAGLCEAFNRTPSQATFMAYEIGLEDLPISAIELAVRRALRECRFMPSPAELRELSGEMSAEDRATVAWDCVLSNVHLGPYKHVSFADDRIINATIRNLGGWPMFVSRFTDAESEKWLRLEFCKTYRSLHRANVNGDICRPLPGLAGGTFSDGREHVPKIDFISTPNLTPLPAPMSAKRERVGSSREIPHVEFRKP
jgi:hypothetical protein